VSARGKRSLRRATARGRLYFVLFAAWAVLTFVLTSIPDPGVEIEIPHADKLAHFGFYAVMAFWCALWRRETGDGTGRAVLFAVLFVAAAGAADELHQRFVPGRTTDLLDWMADAVGGFLGAGASAFLPTLFPFLLTE